MITFRTPLSLGTSLALVLAVSLAPVLAGAQTITLPNGMTVEVPQEGAPPKPGALRKYADVITKDAVTQSGMFKVHRIDDRLLFEIPPAMMGREFLWQTEIAELPQGAGYPGTAAGTRVITFSRRNNKIYMRNVDFSMRTEAGGARKEEIDENSIKPIIMSFDVLTENGDKSAVIDVTGLFTSDPADFSVRGALGVAGADPSRSYVDRVKAFSDNIEVRSFLTFMGGGGQLNPFGPPQPTSGASALSATIHYSIIVLPEKPMMGRLKDSRIGYFTTGFTEYGSKLNRPVERQYINRFRLEKKHPELAVSDPVKPITFYLSREVPEKWRPYLKKAIEDWQPAFETAGFSHAIVCKDAPTRLDDPNWDPEDVRYSVIRWVPSETENAIGPSVQDPRSGETLSAHVIVWDNIVELVEAWYFSQVAAIDPRARHMPLSDELLGPLLTYVVCHEVGHTLGLEHNFKASAAYTVAQLRDPKFTDEHGVAASIMSYSRYNYVAQPGDGVKNVIGRVGPYDIFAIHYGYTPIFGAKNPDDEKPMLDRWLSAQVNNPWLRFGNYKYPQDPTTQMERIGSDSVEATRLGLKNIDLIAKDYLFDAGTKYGDDYTKLTSLYAALMGQRLTELIHVAELVGGVVETDYHAGRGNDVFRPVPAETQARAVALIVDKGFNASPALYDPKILNRIMPDGLVYSVRQDQVLFLDYLLSSGKIARLQDDEALNGAKAYRVSQLVTSVTDGIWSELGQAHPKVNLFRRELQRAYLETMDSHINGTTRDDLRLYARSALTALAHRLDKASHLAGDQITGLHLADSRKQIELILLGKTTRPTPYYPSSLSPFGETTGESGGRSQEAGVRSKESGVRSQESGVGRQESGVGRRQETGVRRQDSGVRSKETGFWSQESGDGSRR